jgi:hypothetical protein
MDEVAYRGSSLDTFDFSGAGTLADSLRSGSGADGVVDGCSLPGTDCWAKLRNAAAKEWELWDCVPGPGPGTACPVVTLGFALPFVETTTFGLFGNIWTNNSEKQPISDLLQEIYLSQENKKATITFTGALWRQ